jgi:hypothetical protein
MSKRTKADTVKTRALFAAVKDRRPASITEIEFQQQARLAKLRHPLGRALKPILAAGGFDLARIDRKLQANQAVLRKAIAADRAATARQVAALVARDAAGRENTRRALEHIAYQPLLSTAIPLRLPIYIGARPAGFLVDAQQQPGASFARAKLGTGQDTSSGLAKLSFYFSWTNPSKFLAVINCAADLISSGALGCAAEPGLLFGGSVALQLGTQLNVFAGTTTISWQPGQRTSIAALATSGGGIFGFGDVINKPVADTAHLHCETILVEGNQTVFFEVALVATYTIDDANVSVNFADDGGSIACPGLTVELLTPPVTTTPPIFTLPGEGTKVTATRRPRSGKSVPKRATRR